MVTSTTRSPAPVRDEAPAVLSDRFEDALSYATRVHRGQTRRGRPFVAHLLRVAGLVLEDGGSENEAIAALLHDAAEDQGGRRRLQDIRRRYGDEVAGIVDACTDSYEVPPPPWRARKEEYLEHLPSASQGALRVSLADKVDNVRTILGGRGNAEASAEDACWYYTSLARLFDRLQPGARADELTEMAADLRVKTRAQ